MSSLSNFEFEFILNKSSLCLVSKICVKQFHCFITLMQANKLNQSDCCVSFSSLMNFSIM